MDATFTSERYGYTIGLPRDWTVQPATETWSSPGRPHSPIADIFHVTNDHLLGNAAVLVVAARVIPESESDEEWISTWLPRRPPRSTACSGSGYIWPAPMRWQRTVIEDRAGWRREECGFVDRVIVDDGIAYAFSLRGPYDRHGAKAATVASMDGLLATVKLDAELPSAAGSGTVYSDVYGYSIDLPAGWTAEPSSVAWIPGVSNRQDASDRLSGRSADPGGTTHVLRIASAALSDGSAEDGWLADDGA